MVIGIIVENCSGKSKLAARIRDAVGAEIVTGKEYTLKFVPTYEGQAGNSTAAAFTVKLKIEK